MSTDTITANIARVLRLAYKVDAFEAGEGKLDGVADLLRKLAAALRRDVDAELERLRAEVERLTEQGKQNAAVIDGLAGDLDRLTRERDAGLPGLRVQILSAAGFPEARNTWVSAVQCVGELRARAETAERELLELRRRVCVGDFLTVAPTPKATAERNGWLDLYPDEPEPWCDECEDQGSWACSKHAGDA